MQSPSDRCRGDDAGLLTMTAAAAARTASTDDRKRPKLSTSNEPHQHQQQRQSPWRRRGVVAAVRKYRGHVDGVWDVAVTSFPVGDTERPTLGRIRVVGAASADGTACLWNADTGSRLVDYVGHSGSVNSVRFRPRPTAGIVDDGYVGLVLTSSGDRSAHVWRIPADQLLHIRPSCSSQSSSDNDDCSGRAGPTFRAPSYRVETPECQLIGHDGVVIAADWLNGGGVGDVITASWDRTAIVHDCETGRGVATLKGHVDELTHCCGHRSQPLALTSSKDATWRLWDARDVSSPACVYRDHSQSVTSAVFASLDCDVIVSGSDDGTARVLDLRNAATPLVVISAGSPVNRLSVSELDQLIALPQDNGHIQLYSADGVRLGRLTKSHSRMVCAAAWSEKGTEIETETETDGIRCRLFTCGFDRRIIGWTVSYELMARSDAG